MFNHMKVVCLSVGLLVALSGLSSVSSAIRTRQTPVKSTTVTAVTLQTAQNSAITGAALRAIAVRY
jgi:hypothetical protein